MPNLNPHQADGRQRPVGRDNGGVSETRSGYRQSISGLVGAIAMSLLLIGAIWLLSRLQDRNPIDPVPTVDYTAALAKARADAPFAPYAPGDLPSGWRATSASYTGSGVEGSWHVGFLTSSGNDAEYVGLDQSNRDASDFRAATTRADEPGATVTISGRQWQLWTSQDGKESALERTDPRATTTIVSGTAGTSALESFVAGLTTR
jgi:hypothetical protein